MYDQIIVTNDWSFEFPIKWNICLRGDSIFWLSALLGSMYPTEVLHLPVPALYLLKISIYSLENYTFI
jgi:hypothetical protein